MASTTPPVPFTLYAIYDGIGPELETATVVRVTAQNWWFKPRPGLAFHCTSKCSPGVFHLSAADAWAAYYTHALADKTDAEQRMVAAEKAIEAL